MRRVLIVAHDFPPHGGGGVMRALKFVKYLPQFGWTPLVLTVRPEYYRFIDESLLAEVPSEAVIIRTASLQSKGRSYQKALNAFHGSPRRAQTALKVFRGWLNGFFLVHQDEDFLWLPWAWREANSILQEHRADLILTTSPPHCAQWLGLMLRKRYNLPWVVDLRDGWLSRVIFRARFLPRRWAEQRVERAVVHHADRVITATGPIRDDLVQSYPSISDKALILTNGFDPADFLGLSTGHSNDHFDIAYVGSLGGVRRPIEPLFRAIAQLLQQMPDLQQVFRLRFVGSFGPTESQLVREYELTSVVSSTGWVKHEDAIQYMLDADVLLVLLSELEGGKEILTGKVFEYIAAERPIFALAPPDAAVSRFIRAAGLGVVASPTDGDEIRAAIRGFYERFRTGTLDLDLDPEFKQRFSRVEQTRTLAGIFEEVVRRANP